MKTKLLIGILSVLSLADAALTVPQNLNNMLLVQGSLKKTKDDFDLIINKDIEIKVKHSDLLRNNKTEPDLLLKRTSFKINIKDIQDIRNR